MGASLDQQPAVTKEFQIGQSDGSSKTVRRSWAFSEISRSVTTLTDVRFLPRPSTRSRVDVSHRGYGLLLLKPLLESAPGVEYFVGGTANAHSSGVLDRLGVPRCPAGDWERSAFWITNHDGFARCAVSRKGWPGVRTPEFAAQYQSVSSVHQLPDGGWEVQSGDRIGTLSNSAGLTIRNRATGRLVSR
jgi:hypothetical protein